MSLNPPRQPSGAKVPRSGPDAEALLLEAVRHRRGHESLVRLQSCVHRRGLDWLEQFQTLTLPALEGEEAAFWFEALLGDGSAQAAQGEVDPVQNSLVESGTRNLHALVTPAVPPGGGEEQARIEQWATAAVDGAIASMLAEFPELVAPAPPLGFVLPLTAAPPAPAVPEVLPTRTPPPVFSFAAAPAVAPLETAGLQLESLPGDVTDASGREGFTHLEPSGSAEFTNDPALFDGLPADSAAPWQRSAAEIGASLGSRLLRRLSRTNWRSLARIRLDRAGAPQAIEPPVAPELQPSVPKENQGPVLSPISAGPAPALPQDHASGQGSLAHPPDHLAVVGRLAKRRSDQNLQQDAAPALAALADLRAWLPDSSLPRAS